ncbi:chaplin [Streptomyces sp. NPDC006544]
MRLAGGSPGVLSGNLLQGPAGVPVYVGGRAVDAIAPPNPASGGSRVNV